MSGPLDGFRVVDLTAMISGPLATMTLADQGADVIKVETPSGGDFARHVATRRNGLSASFLNNNRNKRSIIIDLKHARGLEVVHRLIGDADVFVQNFRPGVADRLGLGLAELHAINPRLVYVSITGFGFDGPYADKPVFDPLIQGLSGLTTVQAGSDQARPRLVRTILPDKLTGIQASQAITAALLARERTGQGQQVRLSMLDTLVSFLWSSDMGGHTFVGDELEQEVAQSYIDLIYETADGYITVAAMHDKHWTGFANAMNRPDLLDDPRFTSAELRDLNKDDRVNLMQECLRGTETDALIAQLEAHDVPCSPILKRREMINHPQILANEIIEYHDHPVAGRLRQARQPARFSVNQLEYRFGAPGYGENTRQILQQSGYNQPEIAQLLDCGAVACEGTDKD